MIAVGNKTDKNKSKDRWNYFHRMTMLPFLVANHCIPLLHMDKRFIWMEKKGKLNN